MSLIECYDNWYSQFLDREMTVDSLLGFALPLLSGPQKSDEDWRGFQQLLTATLIMRLFQLCQLISFTFCIQPLLSPLSPSFGFRNFIVDMSTHHVYSRNSILCELISIAGMICFRHTFCLSTFKTPFYCLVFSVLPLWKCGHGFLLKPVDITKISS